MDTITAYEQMREEYSKYEKALEIIAKYINPSIVILFGSYYWKECVNSTEIYHALTPEDGKLLMELFGGTNYDTK